MDTLTPKMTTDTLSNYGSVLGNTPITSSQLNSPATFNLSTPKPLTATDGALGAIQTHTDAFTQSLLDDVKQRGTDTSTSLQQYLQSVLSPGPASLTDAAYRDTVDPAQADLQDINNQITAEQNGLQQSIESLKANPNGLFGTGLDQEIQRLKDASLARQANLSVIQMARQGKADSAKAIADRAVAAKVEQSQRVTDALKANYEDNKSLFSDAEQRAFTSMLADRAKASDTQAYAEKAFYDELIKQNDPLNKAQVQGQQITNRNNDYFGITSTPSDPVSAASSAILGNESNGSYTALSPIIPSGSAKGQRSYGKYQVLESNIPAWTKQYYGQQLTPQEFLNTPAAQEAVQRGKIQDLWNQYGNINDVASVYFSGVPYDQAVNEGRKDQATGMTVQQYAANAAQRFNQATGTGQMGTTGQASPLIMNYVNSIRNGTAKIDDVPKALQASVLSSPHRVVRVDS